MKNLLNRLKRRGGFTIVECIIAIAVFAALTLVVFMILTVTRNEAKKANDSEENLSKMIQNVIGDDSYRDPEGNYESLLLKVGNTTVNAADANSYFTVSYNLVNGYKNFIECTNTSCAWRTEHDDTPYRANHTEFMVDSSGYTISTAVFHSTGSAYRCPMCLTAVSGLELRCDECDAEGSYSDSTLFGYLDHNDSYYCKNCGGSNVMALSSSGDYISELAQQQMADGAGDTFSLSGMYANAIKYGRVATPEDKNDIIKTYVNEDKSDPCESNVTVSLQYTPYKNAYTPGKYKLTLTGNRTDGGGGFADDFKAITIDLPPYYDVIDLSGDGNPTVSKSGNESIRKLTLSSPTHAGSYTVEFRLKNVKSGYAFEYDYNKSGVKLEAPDGSNSTQGLFAWLGCGSASISHGANGYITGTGTGTITYSTKKDA